MRSSWKISPIPSVSKKTAQLPLEITEKIQKEEDLDAISKKEKKKKNCQTQKKEETTEKQTQEKIIF